MRSAIGCLESNQQGRRGVAQHLTKQHRWDKEDLPEASLMQRLSEAKLYQYYIQR